jgi:carbamoyl-phosphate synthase large subunit
MPRRNDLHKILIIGSGPIIIGQACEFDYSGNQAVKALKEEGYEVVLVNPNPATVMTARGTADAIYMDPLEVPYLEEIIKAERPDALLPTMGGQTALNLTMDLAREGVLDRHGVEVIGARLPAIIRAEDRGEFKKVVAEIGLESPVSELAGSAAQAREFVQEHGLPLIIRPSYTLGGRGGSIARTPGEVELQMQRALDESPVHTALIEESLLGWKEFELEVMRDQADNAVVVCSIENVDPMGVHTGDSITVAPVQTLSDREYQRMRTAAINILRAVGIDCGGSNVQFGCEPGTDRMVVIEMNPRVSRSSALSSKATGFPIARCAAKLAVGYTLDEIVNDITGKTVSCFEPALDYVAVKVPRFEFDKFPNDHLVLGTQMKSVGESLAIGRSFPEALNKALRAAEIGFPGLTELSLPEQALDAIVDSMHPKRIFAAYTLVRSADAAGLAQVSERTGYDPWFIAQLMRLAEVEKRIETTELSAELLLEAKRFGIADVRIAQLAGVDEQSIEERREREQVLPVYHMVDTCAGEFVAHTPYFYATYGEIDEGEPCGPDAVLIIGSGPNRIGQGLEFDTCCTLSSLAYRRLGITSIMVNSNPETVSTDFNVSDRLYIEPLTAEDVKAVLRKEQVTDVVVQLGGQTPLNMAADLQAAGARVVGTSVQSIRNAEDRGEFSSLVQRLGLRQPQNQMATSPKAVLRAAEEIGFPVLLRPSFVLGGKSMTIAYNPPELDEFLRRIPVDDESPVLVDQFLEDAFEYDLDGLCDGTNVYVAGIMQHIEAAGIHSGDSACVFPAFKSNPRLHNEMADWTARIALDIGVRGFLNLQFAVKDSILYVLEVNPRASRTVPFLSKTTGVDLVDAAVRLWRGESLIEQGLVRANGSGLGSGRCDVGWAVK